MNYHVISAGSAICGAAAVLAVEDILKKANHISQYCNRYRCFILYDIDVSLSRVTTRRYTRFN